MLSYIVTTRRGIFSSARTQCSFLILIGRRIREYGTGMPEAYFCVVFSKSRSFRFDTTHPEWRASLLLESSRDKAFLSEYSGSKVGRKKEEVFRAIPAHKLNDRNHD